MMGSLYNATLVAFTVIVLIIMGLCCAPGQRTTARTVLDLADGACVLIHARDARGISLEEVCATEEELSPLVHAILGARRAAALQGAPDAGPGDRSAPSGGR